MDKVAIVVVNYRTPWHLNLCLQSVFKHTQNFHLFLVQNSPDAYSLRVGNMFKAKYPEQITIIHNQKNLGYVGGVNSAYSEILKYERICLLNSDIIVTQGWLATLNEVLDKNPDVVQVWPDTNSHYPEKGFWRLVQRLPWGLNKLYRYRVSFGPPRSVKKDILFEAGQEFYWSYAGYCNLSRVEPYRQLGYILDPNIVHGYWDDFDQSYYLRQFGKVGISYRAYVFHFLNASFNQVQSINRSQKQELASLNGLYVMQKWQERLAADTKHFEPAYLQQLASGSEVIKTYLEFLHRKASDASFFSWIQTIPAKAVGEKFLG